MLKILKFVSQKGFIDGGSTKPVIIEALNSEGEISQYVVKIFKEKHERDNFSTSKEFISSYLASEFDLTTPDYFVINIEKEFVYELYDAKEIDNLHFGYLFCTKFISGCILYNQHSKNYFLKGYDYANVFSFDFLMLNLDRGGLIKTKSNLLVKGSDFYLIDHELTLPFYSKPEGRESVYSKKVFYAQSSSFNMSRHIFHHFLKKKNNKKNLFDEFQLNLNTLNFRKTELLFKDFIKFNIINDGVNGLTDYLMWCKSNNYVMDVLHKKIL